VPTRHGQRFCNACGVALASSSGELWSGELSSDDTPTDQVPVVPTAPAPDDLDQFFDTSDFLVVEQAAPTSEFIGRLAAEDPTPPHGTPVVADFTRFDPVGLTVRWRLPMVLLAAATAVAVAAASIFTVVSMDSSGEVNLRLALTANDFTSNAMVACLIAVGLLLAGAVAGARGHRFAVGLIGGAGAAAGGLMLWVIGQAIAFVDSARHIVAARGGFYRLHLVLESGFFMAIVAAVLGGACLVVSVLAPRNPAEVRAHPAVGALGALGSLVLVVGVILPTKSGRLADNFSSAHAIAGAMYRQNYVAFIFRTLYAPVPPITTWFRLLMILLILVGGVVGFLRASGWGLGLAVGSMSVPLWLTITSLFDIGSLPYGIGGGNVGSVGHPPHVLVTFGFVVILVAALAHTLWWWRQVRSEFAAT
jgi:hypothetical protein